MIDDSLYNTIAIDSFFVKELPEQGLPTLKRTLFVTFSYDICDVKRVHKALSITVMSFKSTETF